MIALFITGVVVTALVSTGSAFAQHTNVAREIARVAQQPSMRAAFEAIAELEPATRSDHLTLTEILAPPFAESARAERYDRRLVI